jgi:hypothetical protein
VRRVKAPSLDVWWTASEDELAGHAARLLLLRDASIVAFDGAQPVRLH